MKRLSFRVRLTLFHTGVVAGCLGAAALGAHWTLSKLVLGHLDGALVALAETEAAALESDPAAPVRVHEFAPGTAKPQFARLDRFVQIAELDGDVLAWSATLGTARLPLSTTTLDRLRKGEIVFETFDHFGDEPIRVAALPIRIGARRYAVQVAGSLDDAYAVLASGRWLFGGLSALLLAAVAFASAVFARRALQPIDEIVARARSIGESNLEERLPVPGSQDEIGRLVDTLNGMLERVERGIASQKRFVADASHELRSPLSRLRAELEVTLRRPREAVDYEESLRSCLEEVERLSRLTEELLTLAHLDSERPGLEMPPAVLLLPLVEDAMRRLEGEAQRCEVRMFFESIPPPLEVRASPAAVRLALTNVLGNAVKFSPAGSDVRVGVSAEGSEALIVVSDSGPGVEAGESARLFDRFHRGGAGLASDAPGFGLGLAISRAALKRQGGQITAANAASGGAKFSIRLPLAS